MMAISYGAGIMEIIRIRRSSFPRYYDCDGEMRKLDANDRMSYNSKTLSSDAGG